MTANPASVPDEAPTPITFGQAFAFWLKLGFISFGGPAGQISIMHEELVERRRWISENRFLHALNYCMVLPGPEAQQLATYIGWLMHRTWGGIVAGGLFVLPSLFILIALSWVYMAFGTTPAVAGLFYGIKPAVTAIVVSAAIRIGSRALKNRWLWGVAVAAFVAVFAVNLPFPLIVLGAGLIGHFGGRYAPDKFAIGSGHGQVAKGVHAAIIDNVSVLNVTSVGPTATGFVSTKPCGVTDTSSLINNFLNETTANATAISPGTGSQVCTTASVPTDIIVDLLGEFVTATS